MTDKPESHPAQDPDDRDAATDQNREAARRAAFEAAVLSDSARDELEHHIIQDNLRSDASRMRLRCYLIGNEQPLQPVEVNPGDSLPEDSRAMHWVDVEDADRAYLDNILAAYDLHPLHIDAFTDPGQVSRVIPVDGAIFLEFNVLSGWERPDLRRLSILQRNDLLITAHTGRIPGLEDMITRLTARKMDWARDTSALLYHLLDHLVDDTFQFLMTARSMIVELNDLFDEEPDELEDQDIHGTRRAIGRLAMSCEDQYYVISALQALDQAVLHLDIPREYLRDLMGHVEYANRYVTRLDERAKELKFMVSTTVQQRSEDRLRTLTIIMAIFNPLTFIAGLYGMNFKNIPELNLEYGYFYSLGLMGVVAIILLLVFWKRGWFD